MEFGLALVGTIIALLLAFIISSLPLYLSVKFLGGKTSILKTVFISIITGFIVTAIKSYFSTWGGILAFVAMIWIYHEAFRLKWLKAILAWILQFVFVAIMYYVVTLILGTILGISIVGNLLT
ncbi:hypothetical protein K9M79_01030 [Candidatus Woesearchaeota archaeon]|nr:hypothetical protein [Candidatus Woesearchaeota archaeon]